MFKPKEMTWKQFEKYCEDLIQRCFPDDKKYRVKPQKEVTYRDGVTKRMDISIAERRPGGRHYVVDCKHFPTAILNENEIQTTLEYKKRSKAAKAIILISGQSNCPDRFLRSAKRQGVPVIRVNVTDWSLVNRIREIFFNTEIQEALS